MLRILIWILVLYIVFKLVRILVNSLQNRGAIGHDDKGRSSHPPIPPYSEIQDADFEDITPSPPSDPQSPSDR